MPFDNDANFPLVSALLVSHNDARYLPDSLGSVLNQDYPSIECILVDDGSTDHTPDLIQRWSDDPRFRYIRIEHAGLSAARNIGIQQVRGNLVAFLDADDWWEPDKTMQQVLFLSANPDAGFCWSDYRTIGLPRAAREPFTDGLYESRALAKYILLAGAPAAPSCWMVRRDLLRDVGGFDPGIHNGSDVELIFRLACNAKGGSIGKCLTNRRMRHDSMSRDVVHKVAEGPKVIEKMLRYRAEPLSQYRSAAMSNVHRYLASHAWISQAWRVSIREALRAAYWKPSYALSSEFWQHLLVGHLFRLIRKDTAPPNSKIPT